MTVSSKKPQESNPHPRSGEMDESDGRLKFPFEDSGAEPINDQDSHYTKLRLELENDALNLEAETWSLSVDQSFLKELSKDSVKRQEVIYELMQTEMHHVRTLKVLLYVYMYELRQSGLVDEHRLERLFPAVDALLSHHQHFLDALKHRQRLSQEQEGSNNYQITQLGDILITQFSGSVGEGMKECYSVFCSHQSEATKFYKDLLQNSKKFQNLIRKISQLPLVRRMGIPECFLLVTQRITKYPVLIERLIKNTEVDTDEYKSLVQGLSLVKDTIEQVNSQVREYEQVLRLREICYRLEPKSIGRVSEERVFRREDLLQNNRTLIQEGSVVWKTPGRQKEIHAVLLSDVLILLQEKDQKFVFATMEKNPPVISLRGLIVREVALEDRAMYLICSCTSNMYEIHTSSKDECDSWISHIREAVNRSDSRNVKSLLCCSLLYTFCADSLKECDDQLRHSVEAKQQVCVSLFEAVTGQECPHRGLLLRSDTSDLQQGETLLQEAIREGEEDTCSCSIFTKHFEREDFSSCSAGDTLTYRLQALVMTTFSQLSFIFCLQVVLAKHSSQVELLQACQSKNKRSARQGNALLEQENQRNMERQKQELANLHKMQAQQREEQQRWEKERERQRVQMEVLEEEVKRREEECKQREQRLKEEKTELEMQRDGYQHDLERLRESLKNLEKDREKHEQEKKKLEKLKKHMSLVNPAINVDDPKVRTGRGFTVSGVGNITATPFVPPKKSDPKEVPPKVPPRRESISPKPSKPYVPIHLRSTTNDTSPAVRPGGAIEQVIPTKLEGISKKKLKTKPSHKRTSSAANIDVREVLPIRVAGKEGGSLRAQRTSSPQRIHKTTDLFTPPGPALNMKPSPSFSSQRRGSSEAPPPAPPPFPKDILDPSYPKEIFL
ncbi:hypothetical protein NQD34_012973 [Periophthalmus magnuspinnatus]|nr:hypothetical protein NQD34_012973 [Periophthalmus magnuspinnatus]